MIKAGRTDLARQATKEAGALEVLQALSSVMWSEPFVRGECETWLSGSSPAARGRAVAHWPTGTAASTSGIDRSCNKAG